uniref:Uncharacterized protein n=1 Tax=Leersia perrieri TaxID=77586 RepID=A0A0D9X4F5_9ORYZ
MRFKFKHAGGKSSHLAGQLASGAGLPSAVRSPLPHFPTVRSLPTPPHRSPSSPPRTHTRFSTRFPLSQALLSSFPSVPISTSPSFPPCCRRCPSPSPPRSPPLPELPESIAPRCRGWPGRAAGSWRRRRHFGARPARALRLRARPPPLGAVSVRLIFNVFNKESEKCEQTICQNK